MKVKLNDIVYHDELLGRLEAVRCQPSDDEESDPARIWTFRAYIGNYVRFWQRLGDREMHLIDARDLIIPPDQGGLTLPSPEAMGLRYEWESADAEVDTGSAPHWADGTTYYPSRRRYEGGPPVIDTWDESHSNPYARADNLTVLPQYSGMWVTFDFKHYGRRTVYVGTDAESGELDVEVTDPDRDGVRGAVAEPFFKTALYKYEFDSTNEDLPDALVALYRVMAGDPHAMVVVEPMGPAGGNPRVRAWSSWDIDAKLREIAGAASPVGPYREE